ncbi:hypothetical protein AG1IA_10364 [Rhizoctonia solani AG-1 IA]|uniref:Uncharacterized protein n=1 Tax=Thanatephorus cucumeris (strain AG1-IA) TaxID=983506 RepID=L8WBQ1_THACA|nr:hypothetical protein AG1IA_10364 [Rhizoctonia solani AG-1 IA]
MPGKWRKGLSWLHTESQGEHTSNLSCNFTSDLESNYLVSSASQRSSSTTSSSQLDSGHPVFALQLDPGYKRHAYLHHIPRKLESLLLFPALPDQRRPPVFSPATRWPIHDHARGHRSIHPQLDLGLPGQQLQLQPEPTTVRRRQSQLHPR